MTTEFARGTVEHYLADLHHNFNVEYFNIKILNVLESTS